MSKPRPAPQHALVAGPHVYLRRPTPRDEDEFLERMRNSRKLHGSYMPPYKSAEDYTAWLKRGRRANCVQSVICRREDRAITGVINLNEIVRGLTQMSYIGYYLFSPFERRGYMTEGLGLMLRHAFVNLKLHRIEAGIQPSNERSIALVKRLGFQYEGTARRLIKLAGRWRDHERWAILAEEWRPRPRKMKQR